MRVLIAYQWLFNSPVYRQVWIIPADGAFRGRVVIRGTLIGENGIRFQSDKAMCKAGRDPQHFLVFTIQLHAEMFTERSTILSDIQTDIEYRSFDNVNKFSLLMRGDLIVQTAEHMLCRAAFIVLNETILRSGQALEGCVVEGFEEIASLVPEYPGPQNEKTINASSDMFHHDRPNSQLIKPPPFPVRSS